MSLILMGSRKRLTGFICVFSTKQPPRLQSALESIGTLAFKYAVLRDMFMGKNSWERMQNFVAPNKFCRSHEAASLDSLARRALIYVEEVAINSFARWLVSGGVGA